MALRLNDSIKASIDESVLCWLATADEKGVPNVSPKELFTYDSDHCLVIANIASPGSIKNIKVNAKVCVSFVHVLKQKGFQLKGVAELITNKDSRFSAKAEKLELMAGKAFPFYSLISVKIERAKPIVAPSYLLYPDTTEEQMVRGAMQTYGLENPD
jgi:predicted pyridoxine 5'-phosphate oxidase superfamily flavin-nucleotide-binding protein